MNKKLLLVFALPLLLVGCASGNKIEEEPTRVLTIYNCEDYISNGEDDSEDLDNSEDESAEDVVSSEEDGKTE